MQKLDNTSFFALSLKEVVHLLQSDGENGVSENQANERLGTVGKNVIEKRHHSTRFLILFNQFKSPLILILIFAAMVTVGIGHVRDSIFIIAAVVINAVLGYYQENKAEKALAELKTYLKQRTRVIRNGIEHEIDSENIVPGDLIRLSQGDRVPADARLISINDLQVDEAVLTGESLPATKAVEVDVADAALGDQHSMVFAGTFVTQGVATALVCRTGFSTELGKIATLVLKSESEPTPLQAAIASFSTKATLFLSALTVVIFIVGIRLGYSWLDMFLISVAIAVSAIPEGLPIALTVILAIGVERMAKRHGVIRKLIAAEALGSTTVILTDKTGTLTMAKLELSEVLPSQRLDEQKLLELALINSNVLVENSDEPPVKWRISGRMVEVALVRSAALRGVMVAGAKKKMTVLSSLPFNAVNKFSVSLVRERGKHRLVFLGAPDFFIRNSTLSAAEQKVAIAKIDTLAGSGKFVLGVATKEVEAASDFDFAKDLKLSELSLKGLLTFHDPIRPNVAEAIRKVEKAGIRTVIVTGDHRGTAESVARQVGIDIGENGILEAFELLKMSQDELKKRIPSVRVIARVAPLDKVRIVTVFQELGEVVAMTGDGVNDAPSIKQANIGVAMGSGTEVARDVADLVLLDDNFETIVAAVEEGRQIMNNVRKVIVFLFSNVANELFLIGGALIVGVALPLNALQILWVNFFSDSLPAIAFAFEKNIDGLSGQPRSLKAGLLDPLMKFLILFVGVAISAFLFGLYLILLRMGFPGDLVRTFIFACFGSYTMFLAFSTRSLEKSIFEYPLFSNRYLVVGTGLGLMLMALAVYLPLLQIILGTVSLPPKWLLGVVLVGVLGVAAIESGKWLFRRKKA